MKLDRSNLVSSDVGLVVTIVCTHNSANFASVFAQSPWLWYHQPQCRSSQLSGPAAGPRHAAQQAVDRLKPSLLPHFYGIELCRNDVALQPEQRCKVGQGEYVVSSMRVGCYQQLFARGLSFSSSVNTDVMLAMRRNSTPNGVRRRVYGAGGAVQSIVSTIAPSRTAASIAARASQQFTDPSFSDEADLLSHGR